MNSIKVTLFALLFAPLLSACGASIKQVAATDAEGQVYQFCIKVKQPLAPLGLQAVILGCATTESAAQEQQQQLQVLYPKATMQVVQVRK